MEHVKREFASNHRPWTLPGIQEKDWWQYLIPGIQEKDSQGVQTWKREPVPMEEMWNTTWTLSPLWQSFKASCLPQGTRHIATGERKKSSLSLSWLPLEFSCDYGEHSFAGEVYSVFLLHPWLQAILIHLYIRGYLSPCCSSLQWSYFLLNAYQPRRRGHEGREYSQS